MEIYSEPELQKPKESDSDLSPKGQLTTRVYGLKRKPTKQRKYTCTVCGEEQWTARKINDHHREAHKSVTCDICGKECNTPMSLERHRYSHNVMPFTCDVCNEGFHFVSELANHKIKH